MARSIVLVLVLGLPVPSLADSALRYLALGDSFTAGTGTTSERSFPSRLAARWREAGQAVVLRNLGVNGYTTDDLVAEELPAVREFHPDQVTLAIGANDLVRGISEERYRSQVRLILGRLVADGVPAAHIRVLPQPDWSRSPAAAEFGSPSTIAARIARYNAILREETIRAHALWVDLWATMEREAAAGWVAEDGLHPSARAYDEWAVELALRLVAKPPARR